MKKPSKYSSQNSSRLFTAFESARRLFKLSATILLVALTSCISVSIGPKAGERSKDVVATAPRKPYVPLKNTPSDGAWQNSVNGNSISYFSTCGDPSDPSLETVSRDLFSGLTDMEVVSQSTPNYNGRGALQMDVKGNVDGVPTRIEAMMFKKNGCTYTLSHVGLPKGFAADQPIFAEFLKGFQAP